MAAGAPRDGGAEGASGGRLRWDAAPLVLQSGPYTCSAPTCGWCGRPLGSQGRPGAAPRV
eukprot:scaffold4781_cov339-Prasinococcus_capsulatus_cf.AAC.1